MTIDNTIQISSNKNMNHVKDTDASRNIDALRAYRF